MQIVSLQPVIEKWNELSDEYVNLYPLVTSLLLMIALIVIFYVINPNFLSARNIRIILAQSATYLILAVGMTLVITSSGIDISIGSMVALIAIVTGFVLVKYSLPIWLGILVLLGMGLLCGLFNAVFISAFKIPAIIITLGSMVLFRGLAYVMLRHEVIFGFPQPILWLARGSILGFPPAFYLSVVVVLIGYYVLYSTPFGSHITAIGGSKETARLMGINIWKNLLALYTIMGLTTGLATLIWIARLNGIQASIGQGVEFHTIAAVVLGGTSLFGGKGIMLGSVIGVLILAVLENGLLIVGLPSFWQRVFLGSIFVAVVALRTLQQTRAK